jgi:hypothetical protein
MKKKVEVSRTNREFLKRIDALTDTTEGCDHSELEEELRGCGIDATHLKESAYDRLRQLATHKYTSLGKDIPEQMSQALRQLSPPTPEEEQQKKKSAASSRVKDFLANIRSSVTIPISGMNQSFAPAYRNRSEEISNEDEKLLNAHQVELDAKEPRHD